MEALIPISLFFCVAVVLILRPITKKLGGLIEAVTRDRNQTRTDDSGNARLTILLEQMIRRVDVIEERLDFTERLVASRGALEPRRQFGRAGAEPTLDMERLAL